MLASRRKSRQLSARQADHSGISGAAIYRPDANNVKAPRRRPHALLQRQKCRCIAGALAIDPGRAE